VRVFVYGRVFVCVCVCAKGINFKTDEEKELKTLCMNILNQYENIIWVCKSTENISTNVEKRFIDKLIHNPKSKNIIYVV